MYGIERSAIAEQARQIVEDNRYQDRITIIQGKVEEVDLPVAQVCFSALLSMLRPCETSLQPACFTGVLPCPLRHAASVR